MEYFSRVDFGVVQSDNGLHITIIEGVVCNSSGAVLACGTRSPGGLVGGLEQLGEVLPRRHAADLPGFQRPRIGWLGPWNGMEWGGILYSTCCGPRPLNTRCMG